jgi:lauroyl/myristoyl acyltransferase
MTQGEMDEVVQRTFKGIFAHYHEKLFMAYTRFKKTCRYLNRRVAVEGCELLDEALARGRGVILVTGHYGAVEFLPLTLALKGYPVTMLLRFKTRQLKEILNRKAENVPVTLVDVSAEENVVFTALKALRSNQILITECDEFECWKPHRSEKGRFLGSEVRLDRSLDMLQGRSGAPICMGLVCREGSNRFSLRLHALGTAV